MEAVKIPLHEFEQHIGEAILGRGLSYFKKGHVHEPVEITPGVYEAIVSGSEDYTVQLGIKKGSIISYACDCPYEGALCKHVVAVIFYLQQDELDITPAAAKPSKTRKKPEGKRKKTVLEQVNGLLDKISYEELKQFVGEQSVNDASFRGLFFSAFIHLEESSSIAFYRKHIKTLLQPLAGRKGFIYRADARKIGKAIEGILATARRHEEDGNIKNAIMICCAVMEEMVKIAEYADDSDGYIGDAIDTAYGMLYGFAGSGLPDDEKVMLFGYALAAFEQGIYAGWNWHMNMLELAGELAIWDEEILKIIKLLDNVNQPSAYQEEQLQLVKLGLLLKMNSHEKAEELKKENISKPSFRRLALESAFANREFEKAIQLANDGIEQDKDLRGLVLEWRQWLLKIAQAQQDKNQIIAISRSLFMQRYTRGTDYYQIMKDNVGKESWTDFIEKIVSELLSSRSWPDRELAVVIYIKEEWWERLLKHISQVPNLREIEMYEQYLSKQYSKELIDLYLKCLPGQAESANSRSNYKDVCRYLNRMLKLGALEQVSRLIATFKVKYSKRSAFMEELKGVYSNIN